MKERNQAIFEKLQVPYGLKPVWNDKTNAIIGTTEVVP